MKAYIFSAVAVLGLVSAAPAQIAMWTFETSAPVTAGPHAAEVGTGSATGFHAGVSTYSSPAGNGSPRSFSSNTWAVGDYYQFQTSTVGFSGLLVYWDQTGSSTGPRDFSFSYSTDGTNFTTFGAPLVVLNNASPAWNSTTFSFNYRTYLGLGSVTALDNQASVFFRLTNASTASIGGGTVAAGGTGRVDNFFIGVPEPSTFVLCGVVFAGGAVRRWRGKK